MYIYRNNMDFRQCPRIRVDGCSFFRYDCSMVICSTLKLYRRECNDGLTKTESWGFFTLSQWCNTYKYIIASSLIRSVVYMNDASRFRDTDHWLTLADRGTYRRGADHVVERTYKDIPTTYILYIGSRDILLKFIQSHQFSFYNQVAITCIYIWV